MESARQARLIVDWVNKTSKYRLGSGTHSVLLALALAHEFNGACLSIRDIVERAAVSEATVHRAIRVLERDGVIAVSSNGGSPTRTGFTNRYLINGFDLSRLHVVEKKPVEALPDERIVQFPRNPDNASGFHLCVLCPECHKTFHDNRSLSS